MPGHFFNFEVECNFLQDQLPLNGAIRKRELELNRILVNKFLGRRLKMTKIWEKSRKKDPFAIALTIS